MIETTSVKRDIHIRGSIEKVWEALTTCDELNNWYTRDCQIDFRIGGHILLAHGWGAYTSGTFTEIIKHEKYIIQHDDQTLTITTLVPEAEGVRVSIEYQMKWAGDEGQAVRENMAYGTYLFMKNLKSVLEEAIDLRPTMWQTWIGVFDTAIRPDHYAKYGVNQGTLVLDVREGSPAEDAGLQNNDVITESNGEHIRSYADLQSILAVTGVHQSLTLTIVRHGQEQQIKCKVAPYPREYTA